MDYHQGSIIVDDIYNLNRLHPFAHSQQRDFRRFLTQLEDIDRGIYRLPDSVFLDPMFQS